MDEFIEGDLVRLKCGGPEIEVVCRVSQYQFEDGPAPAVFCLWEDRNFRFELAYPLHVLERVSRARPLYERRRYPR
jgi:uncharacterized protein YodC (DUF2158 family)